MNKDAIYSETYKGHVINIYQDLDAQSPQEWGDDGAFLVHFHRDCWIENTKIINENDLRAWYNGEKIEQQKDYTIFAVSALIHGGVWLSLENTFPSDSYGWDTSHVGAVLVSKKEAKNKAQARKIAQGIINTWNDYLQNNIYGFVIDDDGDSCWGFYGDYEKSGIIEDAKASIDSLVKEKTDKHAKKLKAYIKNNVPLDKRDKFEA